jgi:hypothetical protein
MLLHAYLASGSRVNERDSLRRSLLHAAAGGGHASTVALLLDNKVQCAVRF